MIRATTVAERRAWMPDNTAHVMDHMVAFKRAVCSESPAARWRRSVGAAGESEERTARYDKSAYFEDYQNESRGGIVVDYPGLIISTSAFRSMQFEYETYFVNRKTSMVYGGLAWGFKSEKQKGGIFFNPTSPQRLLAPSKNFRDCIDGLNSHLGADFKFK